MSLENPVFLTTASTPSRNSSRISRHASRLTHRSAVVRHAFAAPEGVERDRSGEGVYVSLVEVEDRSEERRVGKECRL